MTGNVRNMIFTVGHSNQTIEQFVELLIRNGVSAVADVRSKPYSKFTPQFNLDLLEPALKAVRIRYVFLGAELGARRTEAECYVDGKTRYELIARTARLQNGLRRIQEGTQSHRVALMCAEKDPITCHRAILVCRHLRPLGMTISHILEDGRNETQPELEERLLKLTRVEGEDLFSSRSQAIELAYDIQGERIAYSGNAVGAVNEESEVEHEDIYNRLH